MGLFRNAFAFQVSPLPSGKIQGIRTTATYLVHPMLTDGNYGSGVYFNLHVTQVDKTHILIFPLTSTWREQHRKLICTM